MSKISSFLSQKEICNLQFLMYNLVTNYAKEVERKNDEIENVNEYFNK
jgi:hypothetical protein